MMWSSAATPSNRPDNSGPTSLSGSGLWALSCIATRRRSCTAKTRSAVTRRSTPASTFSATPSGVGGPVADEAFFVSFSPAMSPNAKQAIGEQISHWHLNRRSATDLAGLAGDINAQVRGWFNYYGAFYRLRVVCHRSAHRRTPCPMGDAEVQTIARPTHQSVEMARRCPSARATTLRSLAPPRFNPTPNCGSRMTGDCHVRF